MRELFAIVVLVVVAGGCSGDDEESGTSHMTRCEKLRDHVIDLRLSQAPGVDVDAHRKIIRNALGVDFLKSCSENLSEAQVDCALVAADSQAAAACSRN